MQRPKAIAAAGVAGVSAVAYAVLSVGYGLPPREAGAAAVAVAVLAVVEIVLDRSSI